MIVVVGATGQLGTAVIRRLVAAGQPVRAFVRRGSRHDHLLSPGIDLAYGDLRDPQSVDLACRGATVVIATANAVAPEGPSTFEAVEGQGYATLIDACRRHGANQFIFISTPVTPHDSAVPLFRYKRLNEQRLQDSGLCYTIFQASLITDDWLALIGSAIAGVGAEAATLQRRFWFLQAFMQLVGGLIESRGVALIPGSRRVRHAFITLDDVAEFLVRAVGRDDMRHGLFQIGGPQIMTWGELIAVYSRVLEKPIHSLYVPSAVFRAARALIAPFSEAASDIMGLNWLVGYDTPYDANALAAKLGIRLTSAEEFLRQKAAMRAAAANQQS